MAKNASEGKVTRIKASEQKPAKKQAEVKAVKAKKEPKVKKESRGILGYFKGAWYELRQVRWPDRRATWSLTAAVLLFTAFFVLFILLIDALFKYLFELILK